MLTVVVVPWAEVATGEARVEETMSDAVTKTVVVATAVEQP